MKQTMDNHSESGPIPSALDVPDADHHTFLTFPPFPHGSGIKTLMPYKDWSHGGVWLNIAQQVCDVQEDRSIAASIQSDYHDVPLASLSTSHLDLNAHFDEKDQARRTRLRKQAQRRAALSGRSGMRLSQADCWKIAEPDKRWNEPEKTSLSDYSTTIPPFARLLSATRDFLFSRNAEFQFTRTKRLFDLMRDAFGLRNNLIGRHWPGSEGNSYVYRSARSWHIDGLASEDVTAESSSSANHGLTTGTTRRAEEGPDEICVLLTKPEICVRGFLALARKEAEAGWEFAPAYKLTVITAAFLTFLEAHQVLAEPSLRQGIANAAAIARAAPQQLMEARALEEAVNRHDGWNRATWAAWGGRYGSSKRCGSQQDSEAEAKPIEEEDPTTSGTDGGGWEVDRVPADLRIPLTKLEAENRLSSLLVPVPSASVDMLEYIPYARRRIISVLPPVHPSPETPSYASKFCQVVTVPAPWTPNESWRAPCHGANSSGEHAHGDDEQESSTTSLGDTSFPLDRERSTLHEPAELTIWLEPAVLDDDDQEGKRLVGMGLRGRWGRFGNSTDVRHHSRWWAFKPKDYVLPSFWQK